MSKTGNILRGIITRGLIAAAFALVWRSIAGEGLSVNAPLVFIGALYLAGAWFSYLRQDGFKFIPQIMRTSDKLTSRFIAMMNHRLNKEAKPDYIADTFDDDSEPESPLLGVVINLISGAAVILISFVF